MPKTKDIDGLLATLSEKFKGKTVLASCYEHQKWLKTGIPSFDLLNAGFPFGRIIELYGRESSGKSWLSYQLIKSAQRQFLRATIIDAELSFDSNWVAALGVDLEKLFIYTPLNAEDGVDYVVECLNKNLFHLIIIDSVDALTPKKEIESSAEDAQMAIKARIINKALRVWVTQTAKSLLDPKPMIVCINQVRQTMDLYGTPETTPGGRGLKHYASMRVELKRKRRIADKFGGKYQDTFFSTEKNKTGIPFRDGHFKLYVESGLQDAGTFDDTECIIEIAQLKGIISDSAWIEYDNQRFHGRLEFMSYIKSTDDRWSDFIKKAGVNSE